MQLLGTAYTVVQIANALFCFTYIISKFVLGFEATISVDEITQLYPVTLPNIDSISLLGLTAATQIEFQVDCVCI